MLCYSIPASYDKMKQKPILLSLHCHLYSSVSLGFCFSSFPIVGQNGPLNWSIQEPAKDAQFTAVPTRSSQNQRSTARTEEKMSRASVSYLFKGQPEASAIVFKNGRDLLSSSRLLIDHAVTHCTSAGTILSSSRRRLPRSGICPPP